MGLVINLAHADWVEIGSSDHTEGQILSEIVAQTVENKSGVEVKRNSGADTESAFQALKNKRIDLYVDYTGALAEIILKNPELKSIDGINQALSSQKIRVSNSLGFHRNNSPSDVGVVIVREDLIRRIPQAWQAVKTLEGRISNETVRELKKVVEVDKKTYREAAQSFVEKKSVRPPYVIRLYVLAAAAIGLLLFIYTWKRR